MASKRKSSTFVGGDFIPLSGSSPVVPPPPMSSSNKRPRQSNQSNRGGGGFSRSNGRNDSAKKNRGPMYDKNLVPRIADLLNRGTYPDENSIADKLQKVFPEYKRLKKDAFRGQVRKGLEVYHEQLSDAEELVKNISQNQSMNNAESNDSEAEIDNGPSHNLVNQSISDMYSKKEPQTPASNAPNNNGKSSKKKNKARKEESSADAAINKVLAKQVEFRERFLLKPKVTFADFGGIDHIIEQINKLILHIRHPELYSVLGIDPPRGFLLHGPPGVGKTMLVEALASELNINCLKCGSTELVTGISGESEGKIRDLFNLATSLEPCILFIDEIDAITPKRDNSAREMEKRIVTQLLTCLDNLETHCKVIVIGATNRPDALDPALRRSGRFDREISLGIPDESARTSILKVLTRSVKLSENFAHPSLAHKTPGYVGSDLRSLIREAAIFALERTLMLDNAGKDGKVLDSTTFSIDKLDTTSINIEELGDRLCIEMSDFDAVLKYVQPSAKREGFATVPDVTWDDIGALSSVREQLQISILAPIRYPDDVKALGLPTSVGVLLCGPPGCGKTLLAKAIANESGINFISIKGPELLNMYVGESERAVRALFTRARDSKPCVLFFDEIDALCRRRSDEGSVVSSSVVNQLLTEMDGLENRSCLLLAATNRPDILDSAILRPGRFDKIVYVGFPSPKDRFDILMTITKNGKRPPCASDVNFEEIAEDGRLNGFTGADLTSLVREASTEALKERIEGSIPAHQRLVVTSAHFETALGHVRPSVSKEETVKYEGMRLKYRDNVSLSLVSK